MLRGEPAPQCQTLLPDGKPDLMILQALLTAGAIAVTTSSHAETPAELSHLTEAVAPMSRHEVVPGDTLDSILSHAGIGAPLRAEAALAISDVFDLSTLSPGQILRWSVFSDDPSQLARLSLLTQDGTDIVLDFTKPLEASLIKTEILLRDRRETFILDSSLFEALAARNIPHEVVGLGGLLLTPEVADVISLLTVVQDPARGDRLMRLLTGPSGLLGPADLDGLGAWARHLARQARAELGDDAVEVPAWDYYVERRAFREELHPHGTAPFMMENVQIHADLIPDPPLGQAPLLGEQTRELAGELLGLDDQNIDDLIARAVLEVPAAVEHSGR